MGWWCVGGKVILVLRSGRRAKNLTPLHIIIDGKAYAGIVKHAIPQTLREDAPVDGATCIPKFVLPGTGTPTPPAP